MPAASARSGPCGPCSACRRSIWLPSTPPPTAPRSLLASMAQGSIRPADSSVYYDSELYWNALPEVRAYQDRLALGDAADVGIWRYASEFYGRARFERALVLNCGNGWVERNLVAGGVLGSAVGVDIAEDLL